MLLVIFGAGASFDHDTNSALPAYPKVPLANDLVNPSLEEAPRARTLWPGAVPLLRRLNTVKSRGNFNIEEALYAELERGDKNVDAQLLSFLYYIHHVIRHAEVSVRQRNQADTNYTALLDRLQQGAFDSNLGMRLVTFNYDLLLDTACTQLYPSWRFNAFDTYLAGPNNLKLYKPHGSLNWQKRIAAAQPELGQDTISVLLSRDNTEGESVIVEHNYLPNVSHDGYITQPILALPYREKTDFVFPENHKEELIKDMAEVSHILTIGWRGAEQHFHRDVLSLIPADHRVKILNINMGSQDVEDNLNAVLGDKVAYMETFSEGFTSFLGNDEKLESFLGSG